MRKVLIADDERIIREGIYNSIEWESIGVKQVFMAADGMQALDMIVAERPDIAIVDVVMPEMTGLQLISACRQLPFIPKFIIVSGHGEFTYAQEAMRNNAVNYILKPCNIAEITGVVKNIIAELDKKEFAESSIITMKERILHLSKMAKKQLLRDFLKEVELSAESLGIIREMFDFSKQKFSLLILFADSDHNKILLSFIEKHVLSDLYKGLIIADSFDNHIVLIINERIDLDMMFFIKSLANEAEKNAIRGLKFIYGDKCCFEELPKCYTNACRVMKTEVNSSSSQNNGTHIIIDTSYSVYSKPIRQIMAYVKDNIGDASLSLKHIAQKVSYMHPDYLGKLFRKEYGAKFSEYMNEVRVEKAKKLIESANDFKIYEIAGQVGLGDNVTYFSQIFRKHTGLLPSEYRTRTSRRK